MICAHRCSGSLSQAEDSKLIKRSNTASHPVPAQNRTGTAGRDAGSGVAMAAVATPTDRIVMQRAAGAVLSARAVTHSAAGMSCCVYEGRRSLERDWGFFLPSTQQLAPIRSPHILCGCDAYPCCSPSRRLPFRVEWMLRARLRMNTLGKNSQNLGGSKSCLSNRPLWQ